MESLFGAVFEGYLEPPDAGKCELTYTFGSQLVTPMPREVRQQRQSMGWTCKPEVTIISAACSIPALGMHAEEVIISSDPPGPDGSCRLMLQSLVHPDFGVSVLRLESGGRQLRGGDESWEPGQPLLIQAQRRQIEQPRAPAAKRPAGPASPKAHRKRQEESALSLSHEVPPSPRAASPDSDSRLVGCWASPAERIERRPVIVGGIGRSLTGAAAEDAPARTTVLRAQTFDRPDIATGAPAGQGGPPQTQEVEEAEAAGRLVAAAAAGDLGTLRHLLLQLGPDTVPSSGRHAGLSPLIAAAQRGRTEVLGLLLDRKAKVDARDAQGWTCLMHAIQDQRQPVLAVLLEAKASVHTCAEADECLTPLMLAATGARPELCSLLLRSRAGLEARDTQGQKAMHRAAKGGRGGALVALLAARARVDDADSFGLTPLLAAARAGSAECAKMLLKHGAERAKADAEGRTAADFARIYGHERVAAALEGS